MNFIGLTVTLLFPISILKGLTDDTLLAANTQYGKTTYFKTFTIIRSQEDKVFMAQHDTELLTKRELLALNAARSGKSRDILSISSGDTIKVKYAKGFLDLEFRE